VVWIHAASMTTAMMKSTCCSVLLSLEAPRNLFVQYSPYEDPEQYHGSHAAPHPNDRPWMRRLRCDDHVHTMQNCPPGSITGYKQCILLRFKRLQVDDGRCDAVFVACVLVLMQRLSSWRDPSLVFAAALTSVFPAWDPPRDLFSTSRTPTVSSPIWCHSISLPTGLYFSLNE